MRLQEVECKSYLTRSGIPGTDWCVNPYVGCSHACVYCYASFMKRFTAHREEWGTFVDVRVNAPDVLSRELGRGNRSGSLLLSSVTDPYQPVEEHYRLTRRTLEVLADHPEVQVSVLTKSDLVTRDIDLLAKLPLCRVGLTVTTPSDRISRLLEPGASPTSERFGALRKLGDAGVKIYAFIAPAVPFFADSPDALHELFQRLAIAGVKEVQMDPLNFYPSSIAGIERVLECRYPDALRHFHHACKNRDEYRERLRLLVREIAPKYGYPAHPFC